MADSQLEEARRGMAQIRQEFYAIADEMGLRKALEGPTNTRAWYNAMMKVGREWRKRRRTNEASE